MGGLRYPGASNSFGFRLLGGWEYAPDHSPRFGCEWNYLDCPDDMVNSGDCAERHFSQAWMSELEAQFKADQKLHGHPKEAQTLAMLR